MKNTTEIFWRSRHDIPSLEVFKNNFWITYISVWDISSRWLQKPRELIDLLRAQIAAQDKQHKEEMAMREDLQKQQMEAQKQQMEAQKQQLEVQEQQLEAQKQQIAAQQELFKAALQQAGPTASTATPVLAQFDSTSELWEDYWSRFRTFVGANSISEERRAEAFLNSQSPALYKQLANLAAQMSPAKDIHSLTMNEIIDFMKDQYDPKRFIVRERFKFWSDMQRKPGETLQELATRIRQDAATCDFASIKDSLDEALRQRFICSVNNEAVLKALFKVKDDELTFAKAVQIATETEDAAKVAKETVYGTKSKAVHRIKNNSGQGKSKTSTNDKKFSQEA